MNSIWYYFRFIQKR